MNGIGEHKAIRTSYRYEEVELPPEVAEIPRAGAVSIREVEVKAVEVPLENWLAFLHARGSGGGPPHGH